MSKQLDITELRKITKLYNQDHLWNFWDELNTIEQKDLLEQIQTINFDLMQNLFNKYHSTNNSESMQGRLHPSDNLISLNQRLKLDAKAHETGIEAIKSGKVAAFLVAGGDGTRLGFQGPKGAFPITPIKKKSLFQLHAEKIKALELRYQVEIPWYIMTSKTNHQATIEFFKKHQFFELNEEQVYFFSQDMLPAFDENGKLILREKHQLYMSPNGHGGSIKALWDSKAIEDMEFRGIEYLFYFQVDNVLTKICDPYFIGYHVLNQAHMSNKVVRKAYPEEKMGVIGLIDGKTGVIEYSDLNENDMYAFNKNGELIYWAGSIAIHMINVSFLVDLNRSGFKLPYHLARKRIPYIDNSGRRIEPEGKNGIKFESFVFDALQYASKTVSIEVERLEEFSPVKNNEGIDSPKTARRDLMRLYTSWVEAAGLAFPDLEPCSDVFKLEISPLFAMDKDQFISKSNQLGKLENAIYIG